GGGERSGQDADHVRNLDGFWAGARGSDGRDANLRANASGGGEGGGCKGRREKELESGAGYCGMPRIEGGGVEKVGDGAPSASRCSAPPPVGGRMGTARSSVR